MLIKQDFTLVQKTPNVLNVSSSTLVPYYQPENSIDQVRSILDLRRKSLTHFTNKKIFELLHNGKDTLQFFRFEEYLLYATYNYPTKQMIVNLKPFEQKDVTLMNYNDLYAAIVYAYTFSELITNKFTVRETYAKPIINYIVSLFVQVFGKEYGLVGNYSSLIGKLRFLVSCYISASFFGHVLGPTLFKDAIKNGPYNYKDEEDMLLRYDFSRVTDFIKALSETKVMPGMTVIRFVTKIQRFFGVEMLPAFEDLSRFLCAILVSTIPGSGIVPSYIEKFNQRDYYNIVEVTKRMF